MITDATDTDMPLAIADFMPHSGAMCWLDAVIEHTPESIRTLAIVAQTHPCCEDGEIAPWHAIEFMAQSIAAWAGLRASALGKPPPLGFLLGTRRLELSFAAFRVGEQLEISAHKEFSAENGLSAFQCEIYRGGACITRAMLSVFEPANADEFLRQEP